MQRRTPAPAPPRSANQPQHRARRALFASPPPADAPTDVLATAIRRAPAPQPKESDLAKRLKKRSIEMAAAVPMLIKKEKIADDVAPVPTLARKPPPAGHTVPAVQLIEYLPLNAIVPYNAQVCHHAP